MKAITPHLPALQVVVPLIGALLSGLLRRGTTAWALALARQLDHARRSRSPCCWQVLATGPISYHLGGWAPPWGIEYRVDLLNAFVLVLVSGVGAVMMPFARRSVAAEVDRRQAGLVLQHVPAVPDRAARHHRHRRCLQHFRVSRDLVAVDLRADRARQRPAGAGRRLPVSDHGHDRRDLLRHRHRPALSRHRQPQHARHRRAPRAGGGGELAARACRAGLPHRRHLA